MDTGQQTAVSGFVDSMASVGVLRARAFVRGTGSVVLVSSSSSSSLPPRPSSFACRDLGCCRNRERSRILVQRATHTLANWASWPGCAQQSPGQYTRMSLSRGAAEPEFARMRATRPNAASVYSGPALRGRRCESTSLRSKATADAGGFPFRASDPNDAAVVYAPLTDGQDDDAFPGDEVDEEDSAVFPTPDPDYTDSLMFPKDETWKSMDLSPELVDALENELGFTTPSAAQQCSVGRLVRAVRTHPTKRGTATEPWPDEVCMLNAETGSGKTLAYLIPLIELALAKRKLNESLSPPFALILVPTRELAMQVIRVGRRFPKHLRLNFGALTGAGIDQWESGALPWSFPEKRHVIVATPGGVLQGAKAQIFSKLEVLVADEADMLLEGSFLDQMTIILDTLKPRATFQVRKAIERVIELRQRVGEQVRLPTQYDKDEVLYEEYLAARKRVLLFVGATYPHRDGDRVRSMVTYILKRYPHAKEISTPRRHRLNPRLETSWHHVTDADEQWSAFCNAVRANRLRKDGNNKTMTFAWTVKSAMDLEQRIVESGLLASSDEELIMLHKQMSAPERMQNLNRFHAASSNAMLVCTDMASRGMDLGHVDHVIQYDFAPNVTSYFHRVGRTGRAGRAGTVTNIIMPVLEPLAQEIENLFLRDEAVNPLFSRRRGFRKRLKKQIRRQDMEAAARENEEYGNLGDAELEAGDGKSDRRATSAEGQDEYEKGSRLNANRTDDGSGGDDAGDDDEDDGSGTDGDWLAESSKPSARS